MSGPATCSVVIDYPGAVPSATLATQTAVDYGGGSYGMSWTFTVPADTPHESASAIGTCTYPGVNLPQSVLGFSIGH